MNPNAATPASSEEADARRAGGEMVPAEPDTNRPAFLTLADATAILYGKRPVPGLAESRQIAGIRCKDPRP